MLLLSTFHIFIAAEPVVKEDKPVVNGEILENGLEEVKDKGPPKALVKPQVLTHVIEGFVIQEGGEGILTL